MRLAAVVVGLLGLAPAPRALAQEADPAPIPADVEESIARALYERGVELYRQARYAEAHQLFVEAAARSPQGATAPAARRMMARAEMKLKQGGGPDDTRGTVDESPDTRDGIDETETLDLQGDGPIDPYRDPATGGGDDGLVDDVPDDEPDAQRLRLRLEAERSRRNLVIYGGAFGLWHGIALAGATDADEAGVLLALGGASLGLGGTYMLVRDRSLTEGQSLAIMSGATWGSLAGLFMGWAASDLRDDTSSEYDGYGVGTIVGGLAGLGGGLYLASTRPSAGDVALVNSLAGYGTTAGFLVGGLIDPPYDGAYGMNAFIGSLAGVAGGVLAANELEVSRSRMAVIDLGAALGALSAWVLVYPIVKEDESDGTPDTNDDVQITSGVSLAAMTAGAIVAWVLTKDFDARRRGRVADADLVGAPPALLVRGERGGWRLGSPSLRLDPNGPERRLAVDLLGGTF